MENDTGKKKGSGEMTSDEFRSFRHSYGMSQKEWAEAVGISPALVKKIETGRQPCSGKTAEKVWGFIGPGAAHRAAGLQGLAGHVLYDIFFESLDKMDEKEAASCAQNCARQLMGALIKASECGTGEAQKRYFDFLKMFLSTMNMVASECTSLANDGRPVPDMQRELTEFIGMEINRIKQQDNNISLSGSQEEGGQYSLFLQRDGGKGGDT